MGIINPVKKGSSEHIVSGEIALDASNPTVVTTHMTTITGVGLALSDATAPGVGTVVLTYATSGGVLSIYAWKVTSKDDCTLVASTGTETVGYVITGH